MHRKYQGGSPGEYYGRFRLDIRKKSFTERVMKYWKRLPRDVVDWPLMEIFRKHVEVVTLLNGGLVSTRLKVGPDDPGGLFQTKWFYDASIKTHFFICSCTDFPVHFTVPLYLSSWPAKTRPLLISEDCCKSKYNKSWEVLRHYIGTAILNSTKSGF